MLCGASKAVNPIIVVVIIIFWNPRFKKVRYFVCCWECDLEVGVFMLVIDRTCGPKYVNVTDLL